MYNSPVGLRDRVTALIRGPRSLRASPILVPDYQTGWPQYNDWDTEAAVRDGYRAHIAVYRCVTELAGAVSSVPWVAKQERRDGQIEEAPRAHPAWGLLRKANPKMSWSGLTEGAAVCILLSGNHYTLLNRVGARVEMYRLRPDRVQVVPGREGPASYVYRVNGEEHKYPADEVIHHLLYDPGSDYYGLSPLRAAARTVDTDNSMVDWNRYSMRNRARPDGVLSVKQPLSEPAHDALVKQIEEQRSGSENARRVIVVSGSEAGWDPMSLTPVELDFVDSHKMSSRDVCIAFGIHPEAIGLAEATYENKKWAIRAMWEGPILRLLKVLRDQFNLHLQEAWGEDLSLDFDLSETPAVVGARREKAEEAKIYWGMGVPFNTVNLELGLDFDPIRGGDVGYLPMALMPVAGGGGNGDRGIRAIETPAQKVAYWRMIDRPKQAWEKKIAEMTRVRFSAERTEAVSFVENGGRDLDAVISAQAKDWTTLLTATWQAVIEYFGEEIFPELYPAPRAIQPPQTRQTIWTGATASYVARVVGEKVRDIGDTTKRALRAEIAAGIAGNETTTQIAARVRATFGTWMGEGEVAFGTSRSYTIARTEVHGAAGYGIHEGAKQSGAFTQKTWLDSQDERVRETHSAIGGQTRALNEPYSNGLMYPGDPSGPASEVVSCRCTETFT